MSLPWGMRGDMRLKKNNINKKRSRLKRLITVCTLVLGMVTLSKTGYAGTAFPQAGVARDTSEILKQYQVYLDFVVQVGKRADVNATKQLETRFAELRSKNPEGAARFLKGLRFELNEKAQRMNRRDVALNSQNPEIIRWVGRFMNQWAREADEHLYRVYSSQLARK